MKKYVLLSVLCGLLFLSAFAAEKWVTYKSAPGHYSILFPCKPDESADDKKTDDGKPFTMHIATCAQSDDEVYMVGWIDMNSFYPKDKSIKDMLEDSRDGAVGAMSATVDKTIKTNLTGNPYIEFTFSSKDFTGKDRIYIINKFQYSVIALYSTKGGMKPASDKFINSYKYTP